MKEDLILNNLNIQGNNIKKEKIVTINGQLQDISILKTDDYHQKYKIDVESRLEKIIEENKV